VTDSTDLCFRISCRVAPSPPPMIATVGDNEIGEPADGLATEVVAEPDMACHSERGERERAPLLWVHGERWSPGVYLSLRLLGRPLTVAWEGAFIALPTF